MRLPGPLVDLLEAIGRELARYSAPPSSPEPANLEFVLSAVGAGRRDPGRHG